MEISKMVLEYLKVIIWPSVILCLFVFCKKEIIDLLKRLTKLNIPGGVSFETADSVTTQEVKSNEHDKDNKKKTAIGETKGRQYWQDISNPKSLAFVDEIIKSIGQDNPRITYWKSYIALGTEKTDYAWFSPRWSEGYCYMMIRVGKDNLNNVKIELGKAGIRCDAMNNEETIIIPSQPDIFDNETNKALIKRLIENAYNLVRRK